MRQLIFYDNIVYISNVKLGSTTVMKLMDEIKNKSKFSSIDFVIDMSTEKKNLNLSYHDPANVYKKISEFFGKKIEQFFKNKVADDYVVFSHVRDPWSRFLSAVETDFKQNFFPMAEYESSLYNFLQEIKDNYETINDTHFFYHKKYLHILSQNYQGIKDGAHLLKNYIKKIELWNFQYFKKSVDFHFKLNLFYHENNNHGTKLREIVNTFFNNDNDFKQKWQEKNQKDIFLYNLLKDKEKISLDVHYLIKNYFNN